MRCISRILWTASVAAVVVLSPLRAQENSPSSADDAFFREAQTTKNPAMLETRAASLEAQFQFDAALKVMDAALALRAQVNGDHSADYGLSLLKAGALERKAGLYKEAVAHYGKAIQMLPGRPEAAPAFLYLGISNVLKKELTLENLQRAQALDSSMAGPVLMWTAYAYEYHRMPDEADANYKAALAIGAPDSLQTFETLTLYARFLQQQGRDAEAEEITARLKATHPSVPAPKHAADPTGPMRVPTIVMPPSVSAGSSGTGVFRAGGTVTQPSVIYKVDPAYSEEARVAKYSATVLVQLVVGTDGAPHNIKVVKPAGFGLDDCAVSTIAKWKFKPGQKNGDPVSVYANVEVNFRLL